MAKVEKETWVEIKQVVLQPEERAQSLPEETRNCPYILRASGFLVEAADMGGQATIKTIIGREMSGTLITINPSYTHSFGKTVPELLTIGTEAEE
jgi:hypothetical protein